MSQSESMAIPMEGRLSKSELLELKNKMNARALAKKRSRTALRLVASHLCHRMNYLQQI